jgi:uncharacterized membrane protein YbhN (UPF0104 family)
MAESGSRRQVLITIGLVALLIFLLLSLVDMGAVFDLLRRADWGLLLAGTGFLLLCYGLLAVRWRYVLANHPGLAKTAHILNSGLMFSIITPIPNSPFRVVVMDRVTPVKATAATSSILIEYVLSFILRLVGLALIVVLLVGSLRGSERPLLVGAGVVGLMVLILFAVVSRAEQIAPVLAGTLQRLPGIDAERAERIATTALEGLASTGSPRRFGGALLLSFAYYLCAFAFYYLALQALGLESRAPLAVLALGALFLVPPASPMMPGIFHSVMIAPLVALKWLEAEPATAYAVILHAVQMVCLIVLGVWGLSRLDIKMGEVLAEVRNRVGRKEAARLEAVDSATAAAANERIT